MNATIHVNKLSLAISRGFGRTASLASAIGLALLVSGCGGGGGAGAVDATQARQDTSAQEPIAIHEDAGTDATVADASIVDGDATETDLLSNAPSEEPVQAVALSTTAPLAPLGVNLEPLADWSRLQPFVDVMKSARPWGTVDAPWDEAAEVTARGWPKGDAGVVVSMRTVEPGDEGKAYQYVTAGVYKLKFLGRADLSPSASDNVVIRNVKYTASTNTTTADVVVGTGCTQLMLAFRNTNGGVRNVSLRMPGYTETATFNNQFRQALAPFKVVRLMDFLHTNGNPVRTWDQRTLPSSGSQSSPKGAAYEYGVRIANQLNKDIWVNIPVRANDAYVRSLAKLLKHNLASGRVVYVEYSNELWNFVFPQATDNLDAAVREAVAGDRTLTDGTACSQAMFDSGECNPYWAGYMRVGKRVMRIGQIFSEVFGPAAMNKRVRVVYPTQFADPGVAEQVLKNIAKYRGKPSSLIYGIATAPYFYLDENIAASSSATPTQILDSLDQSLKTENEVFFAAGVRQGDSFVRSAYNGGNYTGASHKALADYYGLKNLAYEGGPDLRQDATNRRAKIAANRDPRMGALVQREVSQWFGCGNDLYMHFSLTSAWDQYGYWGLTNDPTNLLEPKYQAARTVATSPKSSFTTCR